MTIGLSMQLDFKKKYRQGVLAMIAISMLSGCGGFTAVKPWDRDILAQGKMQLVSDVLENAVDEHIYFSKEASSGGQGVGGGGCGCN